MGASTPEPTKASTRPTLLLVDDEGSILAALRRLLRREAYQVVTASGGQEGLAELARRPVDVIVSDQRMPGLSGIEFLRRAKELYPDTVRMVLSGYADLQSITDAINEGAIYKFLAKPWDDLMLKGEIEEAFRRKALRDENQRLEQQLQEANAELILANGRLQEALAAAQEVVNCLPVPLLGVDPDGLLAFANAEAARRFARRPLLGVLLAEALPGAPAELVTRREGEIALAIDDSAYRVSCHVVDSIVPERGCPLIFIPEANP